MFCTLVLVILYQSLAACPRWLTGTRAVTRGGAATRLPPKAPYRSRLGPVVVVMAAVPAPATPPSGRPQGPEPLPGRRVSIRPQPMRAPRGEVMALNPTRGWGGFAWAVAEGPTPKWGSGGMAGGTSAAGMRLPLAPRVTGNVPRGSPPSVHRSGRQRVPPNRGATGVGCAASGGDSKPTAADANAHG